MKRAFIVPVFFLVCIITFAENPAQDAAVTSKSTQQKILEALEDSERFKILLIIRG